MIRFIATTTRLRRRLSRQLVGAAAIAGLAAMTQAGVAGATSSTTVPGGQYEIRATITDSSLTLSPIRGGSKYIHSGGHAATFPRGIVVRFIFTNKGTKKYLPALHLLNASNTNPYEKLKTLFPAQRVIGPGGHVDIVANFYFRGPFALETLLDRKPHGKKVQITVY